MNARHPSLRSGCERVHGSGFYNWLRIVYCCVRGEDLADFAVLDSLIEAV